MIETKISGKEKKMKNQEQTQAGEKKCLVSRRKFLLGSGLALATMTAMVHIPGSAVAQKAAIAKYPRKKIGKLSSLKNDKPIFFNYPDKGKNSKTILVKLGTKAGGGVGKKGDVVAFNTFCAHQGGPLEKTYKKATKSLGACPLHLSTYDLTRYGIVISGGAYQSLPQVLLEVKGNDIYAVGVMGLIFGRNDNLKA